MRGSPIINPDMSPLIIPDLIFPLPENSLIRILNLYFLIVRMSDTANTPYNAKATMMNKNGLRTVQ